jgi:hypothetical protein
LRRAFVGPGLLDILPVDDLAHAIVALYLGLELLAHLDEDRSRGARLFDLARQMSRLLAAFGASKPEGISSGTEHND